jgi:hypothetical protein
VTFQFQGSGKLGVVIAVGVNGDMPLAAGVLRAVDIPSDFVAKFEIKLEPINTSASPLELDVWQPQAGSPKAGAVCVGLFDKRTACADAVVTDGDPDCDGWPTGDPKECAPNIYMGYKRPALADAACLLPETIPGNTVTPCVLGGPPCADGMGMVGACVAPTPYCTMQSLCNVCMPRGNDAWNCARDFTQYPSTLPAPTHIRCKLFYDINGKLCTNTLKAFAQPPTDVGGHHCMTGGEFPPAITSIGKTWGETITFTNAAEQLTIAIKNLQSTCNFDVVPSGMLQGRHVFGALGAALLDNGRGIAIPIVFETDPTYIGCDGQVACETSWSWDLSELVDPCVNAPVYPP